MIGAGDKEYTNAYMTKKNRTVITVWKMTEKGVRGGREDLLGAVVKRGGEISHAYISTWKEQQVQRPCSKNVMDVL